MCAPDKRMMLKPEKKNSELEKHSKMVSNLTEKISKIETEKHHLEVIQDTVKDGVEIHTNMV